MDTFVDCLAFGLIVVGCAISLLGLAARINYLRNMFNPGALPLWFRAEGLVLLGGATLVLGAAIAGRLLWPWLFVVVAIVGAVLFLRSRINWP